MDRLVEEERENCGEEEEHQIYNQIFHIQTYLVLVDVYILL